MFAALLAGAFSFALRADPPASYATPPAKIDAKNKDDWSAALKDKKVTSRPALPEVKVAPRTPKLEDNGMYPCSTCHDPDMLEPNSTPRQLEDEHTDLKLQHGGGRFWCNTCHHATDRDQLTSFKGEPISYDASHELCGQCHFQRQREFFFGAHGKRLGSWKGERNVMACVACHDAHSPAIAPRRPYRPEKLRPGLKQPHQPETGVERVWEREDVRKKH